MKKKKRENQELETHFQKLDERLLDFYETTTKDISKEEEDSLLPILDALNNNEDRYEEVELIAEGGEKRIILVHDQRLNRHVAMARAVKTGTKQDQEQFLREAQLEANLAHPNIVPVHNIGFDPEGIPFFTMELIVGDSLGKIIGKLKEGDETYRRNYPLETLLNMYLKICDAIAFAHSRNVLHLDIKPDNIRVGEFGEVFVCDWGLARIVFEGETSTPKTTGGLDGDVLNDMTRTGLIKGTPGFMAPEQTVANGHKTFQTDIYALGALLYMILTYKLPVTGDSANEIIKNTCAANIHPPQSHKKGQAVPQSLAAVALKAMALEPEGRYDSVIELRREITRYLAGHPTLAERAGVFTSLSLLIKRHNRMASILIFFLLLLATVIGATLAIINDQRAEAIAAQKQAEENFRLYREQREAVDKLGAQLSISTDFALNSTDYSKTKAMIRTLAIGLEKITDPDDRAELLIKKGTLHVILQEFNQANKCFKESGLESPDDNSAWYLSNKYSKFKSKDRKLLNLRQTTKLIKQAKTSDKFVYYLFGNYISRMPTPHPEDYLPLAKVMLDKVNKTNPRLNVREPLKIEKRTNGYHLDLTQAPYRDYSLRSIGLPLVNVLNPFNLYSMDISNLPLQDLHEFKRIHVKELNMAGIYFKRHMMLIRYIEAMGVERLILDVDAYPTDIIDKLRQKLEVIDSADNSSEKQSTPPQDGADQS